MRRKGQCAETWNLEKENNRCNGHLSVWPGIADATLGLQAIQWITVFLLWNEKTEAKSSICPPHSLGGRVALGPLDRLVELALRAPDRIVEWDNGVQLNADIAWMTDG